MNQQDMLQQLCERVDEIHDRTRRTETNLHKVREHLGIAGPAAQIEVLGANDVVVQGYDVTLSQIRKRLKAEKSYNIGDAVTVRTEAGVIAVVTLME